MYAVPVILASVFSILLGAIVLVRDFSQPYARAYALSSLTAALWVVANFLTSFYFGNDRLLIVANSMSYFLGYLAIISGLLFTYYFPVRRVVSKVERFVLTTLVLVTLIVAPTGFVAGAVTIEESGIQYGFGILTWFYAGSVIVALSFITRNLLSFKKEVSRQKRLQAQQVLVAFLISALFGLLINVILPVLGFGWGWTVLSPLIVIPFVGIIAYSIIRHGLFDIRVTAAKFLAFLLTFLLFFGAYYYLGSLLSALNFLDPLGQQGKDLLQITVMSFLALFGHSFLDYFDKFVNKILFRHSYDKAEFSTGINRLVTSSKNLQQLLDSATYQIASELDAETAVMVVRSEGNIASSNYGEVAAFDAFLMDIVAETKNETTPMLVEYISESPIREVLTKLGIALYIPFVYNGTLIGFLGLGVRSRGAYNERDVQTLASISTELAVAMQNALYVQRIQDFNESLKNEVDQATADLRASNQKLKQLDQTKDEFISLTSHQLRTPLTTIKGYLSMLLEGDVGEITGQQRKLLEEAFNSSQRMVHLISDFLNISRIQTGKFEIEMTDANLADILEEEIDQLRISATSRQINLQYDKPTSFPIMPIDESKIRQVMMNYIDNAIYYSPAKSTITVVLSYTASTVEFKVIDQGIGVPQAEQHKLFAKFSRASNARKQRPDGTGIGLFMAKKVIVALEGAIIFKSEEGKGSTFGFRLNRSVSPRP